MKTKQTLRMIGSALLCTAVSTSFFPVYAQQDNPTEKTETVFTLLNPDGSIENTNVSSWIHDEDGIENISEELNLEDVENSKTNEAPEKNGNVYTWNVDGNDVYYQGTSHQPLPVSIQIQYFMDGKEYSQKELEGKDGHLKMVFTFENTQTETQNIGGKSIVVHPSYLLGGLLDLKTGVYTNVKCDQGKIINDGTNEMLAFVNIPGLRETLESAGLSKINDQLNITDQVIVEADVKDFHLGSIMMGMTSDFDLDSQLGNISSLSDLSNGINELVNAQNELVEGSQSLYEGTSEIKEKSQPLTSSKNQIRSLADGFVVLDNGMQNLQQSIQQYTNGASAMNAGLDMLYAIPQGTSQIENAMDQGIVKGSYQLSQGLYQLNNSLQNMDTNEINKTLQYSIDEMNEMDHTLEKDIQVLKQLQEGLNQSASALEAMNGMKQQLTLLEQSILSKEGQNNQTIKENNEQISNMNEQINEIRQQMIQTVDQSIQILEESKTDLQNTDSIDAKINELKAQKQRILQIQNLSDLQTLETMEVEFEQLNTMLSQLNQSIASMSKNISQSLQAMQDLQKDIQQALDICTSLKTIVAGDSIQTLQLSLNQLKPSIEQLYNGSLQIYEGSKQLNEKLKELQESSQNGLDQLKQGMEQLTGNNDRLNQGAGQLKEATDLLAGQQEAFIQMANGLESLEEAFNALNEGAKALNEGQNQFKEQGIDVLKEKVDLTEEELNTLQQVMHSIQNLNETYKSFSGCPDSSQVSTRYVYRTKETSEK